MLRRFTAVVLAADRGPHDPVAASANVPCKALTPIGDTPMVIRVLDALDAAQSIELSILCGPEWDSINHEKTLADRVTSKQIRWIQPRATPSLSAYHAMASVDHENLILLTTADHALLHPALIDTFCRGSLKAGGDIVVGVARHDIVQTAFPNTRRTAIRLQDGAYCSCNLFAFLTPQGREVAKFWRRVERHRKNPLRLIGILGWRTVVQYLFGKLSLAGALARLSHQIGLTIHAIELPFPEAALDVDTVSDWVLVQNIARSFQPDRGPRHNQSLPTEVPE
ncbi:MAG TPA: MobA-like NTP transferase domain containing protein [Nitrospirales bacterium]|nr:MobA-like NTP transferase domain containing protein [Nitrospirales bacterium]